MGGVTVAEEKIGGFDKWEVDSAVDTLIESKEIVGKPKFYKVGKEQLAKKMEAMKAVAAEHKVKNKLKETYSHNPGKKSGY